jgi:D-alanine-D-alanine ligase
MRVVLLHDAIGAGSSVDELDVMAQMEAVEGALATLGHSSSRMAFGLNLELAATRLRERRPDVVFNLVESVGGQGRLVHLAPALLDSLGVPYTGAGTEATFVTANKVLAKRLLRGAGIATPRWLERGELQRCREALEGRWIIKSVWEHASRGLDEGAVVRGSAAQLLARLEERLPRLEGEGFIEEYIEGREFNLAVIAGPAGRERDARATRDGPRVLPPAEIVFEGFGAERPRIVGYAAKWDEGSFEYQNTPRRFAFGAEDAELLERLREMALECWRVFGLRGYARVDFRVDERGRPWVLEVNTNPCLSPDAGFAAALEHAGVGFEEAVRWVLGEAVRGGEVEREPEGRVTGEVERERDARATGEIRTTGEVKFRTEPRESDAAAIRDIVASTGFFHDFEIDVAVELVDERLKEGLASEYYFVFAEDASGRVIGYACFGPVAYTQGSFDLYWIAVHDSCRGHGLGQRIMAEAEGQIAAGVPTKSGESVRGRRVYIETSSKVQYRPTREFYLRCGYREEARLADFYAPGDDKLVYVKALA